MPMNPVGARADAATNPALAPNRPTPYVAYDTLLNAMGGHDVVIHGHILHKSGPNKGKPDWKATAEAIGTQLMAASDLIEVQSKDLWDATKSLNTYEITLKRKRDNFDRLQRRAHNMRFAILGAWWFRWLPSKSFRKVFADFRSEIERN